MDGDQYNVRERQRRGYWRRRRACLHAYLDVVTISGLPLRLKWACIFDTYKYLMVYLWDTSYVLRFYLVSVNLHATTESRAFKIHFISCHFCPATHKIPIVTKSSATPVLTVARKLECGRVVHLHTVYDPEAELRP